ncbi:MAG: substrate-binding domain-containing protein [Candidatus Limnocylindrales bacterium]
MSIRRTTAFLSVIFVLAACTSTGASTAPSTAASQPPASVPAPSQAAACTVGVSWNNFQQPRWAAHDEPGIKDTVEAGGGTYISADANLSTEQQLTDVTTMLSQGANVLIILAQDTTVIGPAVQAAKDAGVPVIAYDRLIEDPEVLYITFDNVGVGKAEADAILAEVPTGNYVLIKGDPGDPNASTFLPAGWDEAGLKTKVDAGEITILNGPAGGTGEWPKDYGTYTDAWATETAQANMEAIIDKAVADGNTIDAVLAENDSTALGVAAALTGKNYDPYPPVSGQDGDPANLNNVAKGLQFVDVWKNANELGKAAGAAALALCAGGDMASLTLQDGLIDPAVAPTAGLTAQAFETPGGNSVSSFILQPTPLTAENLQLAIDGGQVTKEALCAGVDAASAPAACQ